MTNFDPPTILQTITKVAKLTQELIAVIRQKSFTLSKDEAEQVKLIHKQSALIAEREQILSQLKVLSATCKLQEDERLAISHLQNLEILLTIANLDHLVETDPENIQFIYHRAVVLSSQGRNEEAQRDFMRVLAKQPEHFGALNDFGNLLFNTGYVSAARTVYTQAAAIHPDKAMAHLNIANLLVSQGENSIAKTHYQQALKLEPTLAEAHQGLSYALSGLGEQQDAASHRHLGFSEHATMTWPHNGTQNAIPLLILSSAKGGNIALKHLLNKDNFLSTLLFAEYFDQTMPLPEHQLIINAIGDADLCPEALEAAAAIITKSSAPVINPPEKIIVTGRINNAIRLGKLPGVITPKCVLLSRTTLLTNNAVATLKHHGIEFPLLLRSPGFHTGQFFHRVETAADLTETVCMLPGTDLLAIEFLDTHLDNNYFHKYRVIFVDKKLYPLHLAASKHWKVHYFSANMNNRPESQQSEELFLNDMHSALGAQVVSALESIGSIIDLDYFGIDFAIDKHANILLFEANATMIVPSPKLEETVDYRRLATERVHDAVRNMIIKRIGANR